MAETPTTTDRAAETPALTGLEPQGCWRHFELLTRLARPSRHEEPAIEHVRAWARGHGFEVRQDAARNLVVRVPATSGREWAPTVVLQGHLDMVCERLPDSLNDPAEGRIELVREGDWLTADGTTLGADNGIGIAAMMALADDDSVPHGPLELLMTVVEEVGGAGEGVNGLDPSLVTGSILLNLDSEEDGRLTVGSAGSTDTSILASKPREACPTGTVTLSVSVSGGLGGHSGTDIARGHSNAIKVLVRALRETLAAVPFRLVSLDGGKSWNAIPRDAVAICSLPTEREGEFRAAVDTAATTIRDAYAQTDPGVTPAVADAADAVDAWTEAATAELLDLVTVVPSGPLAMSPDFDGLVETSTSLGTAVTDAAGLTLHHMSRSSNGSALPEVLATLDAAARLAGGSFEVQQSDPAWRPALDSPTLAAVRRVYERLFGEPPIVTAVHAWLETAVIGEKVPGLDMVSFGPQIEAPHSPDERVSIPTVERFWRLLVGVVDEQSAATT
ncbi:MAG: beta-Ala-His dipeptidase [Gaiellaceae bacterium]